jgi:hypothetical protein
MFTGARSAATLDGTVRSDLNRQPLVRLIIVTAALVWLVGCGVDEDAWHLNGAPDAAHAVVTPVSSAVNADHTHGEHRLSPWCFELSTGAVLSPWAPGFLALGTLAAAFLGSWIGAVRQTRRGPPRGSSAPGTGQVVLTRLCVARR